MTVKALTHVEQLVVCRAMRATLDFFDWDFSTRIGIDTSAMSQLLALWPDIDDSDDNSDACLAVNNALNEWLHGVGVSDRESLAQLGVNRAEVIRIYEKWAASRGWKSTGVR